MAITTQQATLINKTTPLATPAKPQKKGPLVAQWHKENGQLVCRWTRQG